MYALARQLLRVAILVLLLGSVLAQVLVPVVASYEATLWPQISYLAVPYAVALIAVIACVQVALLALWRLLSLVQGGVLFSPGALRWVDVVAACAAVATVLSAGVMAHLIFVEGAFHAFLTLGLVAGLAGGLACVLFTVVVRGVLESEIPGHTPLDAAT